MTNLFIKVNLIIEHYPLMYLGGFFSLNQLTNHFNNIFSKF